MQAMVFGLSQQFGTAAFARPLVLAVQNDLDSSVNFDALFATSSEGSLLLREHVTVRCDSSVSRRMLAGHGSTWRDQLLCVNGKAPSTLPDASQHSDIEQDSS